MPNSRCQLLAAALPFYSITALVPHSRAAGAATAASVEVDARDAPRGLERTHLVLPVKPVKLTLLTPILSPRT